MEDKIIQGNPTKSFFIEMITRDISIKDAILDLLDNSIDGANNINPGDFNNLYIDITVNKDCFIIKDNCGGFTLETAQKYAFRFGRPDEAPKTGGSIGRFGVGMKRALFKIGQNFEVESKNGYDHFQVNVNVNEWKYKKKEIRDFENNLIEVDDWSFQYSLITDETSDLVENGTFIKVLNLNQEVYNIFAIESFLIELEDDIERLLNFSIEKGLKIILNGKVLQKKGVTLFSDNSKPYFHEFIDNGIKIRVVAGLSFVGDPHTSGWYIYCNDRLVLEADKTDITGWGTSGIPQWHVDYVMFKGLVFMDSEETINLPLTTTKKGIDATSIVYKKAFFFMREAMVSVLGFLKDVRKLGDEANDYRKLLGEQETKISVQELKVNSFESKRTFVSPVLDYEKISIRNNSVRISFNADKNLAEMGKLHSGSKSFKEFGEYIFNYYLKMEELRDE